MVIKKNIFIGLIVISTITLVAVVIVVAQSILSGGQPVPNYLNYQGRLIDQSTGQPIPDGSHNATFRIYDAETGGSLKGGPYTSNVTTQNGIFNTLIGPVEPSVFDGSDRWIEIEVDGETISTRQRIVSVAYAIRATSAADADTLGGKSPSEFVTNPVDGDFTVNNGSVLFAGTTGATPTSGAGARMMWIPEKKAFRAGVVEGSVWDAINIGNCSFAAGYDTKANGICSFAMGSGAEASGKSSIAMGSGATASGDYSTAIGWLTEASGESSTAIGKGATANGGGVAIGIGANASGGASTAMGYGTTASGVFSTAMGGSTEASGEGSTAMGFATKASGQYSTAMGYYASTNGKNGSFVYGDSSTTATMNATADNQFMVRAAGGTIFYSNSSLTAGVSLAPGGGSWSSISDRNRKDNFKEEYGEEVLRKIAGMSISSWNYKSQHPSIRHLGPTSQDFYAAFHLGESDTTITTTDIDGINMLAIQALEKRTTELKAKIEELEKVRAELAEVKAENAEMKRKMAQFEAALQKLEALTATPGIFDGSGTNRIKNN